MKKLFSTLLALLFATNIVHAASTEVSVNIPSKDELTEGKYLISVDGGINPETAKLCWNAGADLLVSGSYLAKSHDFPLAVQSLLKHE